jgi:hypothetical protein
MRKLAYIFGIALFLFGCAGVPSLISNKPYLPIDYSEADKNSREIWFEFKGYIFSTSYSSKNDCGLFSKRTSSSGEPKYKILRNGRVL